MKKKQIIINGFNVSQCPHLNAYYPDKPICQQGMGVGGCGSDCNGNCNYIEKLKVEQIKNENDKLKQALEEIKTMCEQPSLRNDYTAINILMILKDYKISEVENG